MTSGSAVAVLRERATSVQMPSMNETLRKWITDRLESRAGTLLEPQSDAVSDDEKIKRLSAEYGRLQQAGLAFSVLRGFLLEQAAALGEKPLSRIIQENDVSRSVAYRDRDMYRLFNKLGDLKLADKGAQLGLARIYELKPYFGIDGIKQLVQLGDAGGLKYSAVIKLPSREVALWVRNRRTDDARKSLEDAAANGEDVPDYTPAPDDPHWLQLVRDQSVTLAWRVRAEIAVLSKLCGHLVALKPATQQRSQRAETAQVLVGELDGVVDDVAALQQSLAAAFGAALDTPRADSRAIAALKARRGKVNEAIAVETGHRAGECLRRSGMRGRPPASLDAAIESALKADDKAGEP